MMYEFHRGDLITLEKYPNASSEQLAKAASSRSQSLDSRKNESFQVRDSRKVTPPRPKLLNADLNKVTQIHSKVAQNTTEFKDTSDLKQQDFERDTDINPNISIEDTPVAASKVLKPGSKKKLMIDQAKKLLEQNPSDPEWQQNYVSFSETIGNNWNSTKFTKDTESHRPNPTNPTKTSDDLFKRFMEVGVATKQDERIRIQDEGDRQQPSNLFGVTSLSSAGRKLTNQQENSPNNFAPSDANLPSAISRKRSLQTVERLQSGHTVLKPTPRSSSVGKAKGRDTIRQESIKRIRRITDQNVHKSQQEFHHPGEGTRRDADNTQYILAYEQQGPIQSDSTRPYRSKPHPTPATQDPEEKYSYLREKYKRDSDQHSGRVHEPQGKRAPSPAEQRNRLATQPTIKRTGSAQGSVSKDKSHYFRDEHFRKKFHTELTISPVSKEQVLRVLEWVQDLGYLRSLQAESDLSDECKEGSFFFKLINHIERENVLQGANTASPTGVRANFERVFAHLKKYEKFNPRYLCSEYYLMNGNKDVFWGLLDDIRLVYNNKVSSKDTRYKRKRNQHKQSQDRNPSLSPVSYNLSDQISKESRSPVGRREQPVTQTQKGEWSQFTKRQLELCAARRKKAALSRRETSNPRDRSIDGSTHPRTEHLMRSGVEIGSLYGLDDGLTHKSRTEFGHASHADIRIASGANISQLRSPKLVQAVRFNQAARSRFVTLENTTISKLKKARIDPANLAELEAECRLWLQELNIKAKGKSDGMFDNPLRNGYVLCMLASLVYQKKLKDVCREPRSVTECRNNIESALNLLRTVNSGIPQELLWQTDEILKGNPQVIWQLIAVLKLNFESEAFGFGEGSIARAANLSSINSQILPYTTVQVATLKNSLLSWVIHLGVFNDDPKLPTEFDEVSDQIQKGALLARMIQRVTGTVLKGIHHKPISKPNFYHNVLKCLDYLKSVPSMSRRFIWKVEPIVDNDKFSILGLLEDFHRFSEGLPARKDPNYFSGGPFIKKYDLPQQIHVTNQSDKRHQKEELHRKVHSNQGIKLGDVAAGQVPSLTPGTPMTNFSSGGILQFKLPEETRERDRSRSLSSADLVKIIQTKPQAPAYQSNTSQKAFFDPNIQTEGVRSVQHQQHSWTGGAQQEYTLQQSSHLVHKHTFESAYSSTQQQAKQYQQVQTDTQHPRAADVVKILLLTNLPKVVERETWDSPIWTLFSDG